MAFNLDLLETCVGVKRLFAQMFKYKVYSHEFKVASGTVLISEGI